MNEGLIRIEFLLLGFVISRLLSRIGRYYIGTIYYVIHDKKISYGLKIDDKKLEKSRLFKTVELEVRELNEEEILRSITNDKLQANSSESTRIR